uniref:SEFIR domain-containing protein n=1 Tax=Steinernema glaseri TaxID=37863 RepID=A0A1I7ZEX4_9BILA
MKRDPGDVPLVTTYLHLTLLLSQAISLVSTQNTCREDVQLRNINDTSLTTKYYIETDTKKCSEHYPQVVRTCTHSELDLSVRSVAVLPNGLNMLPHVDLNVSMVVYTNATSVFLRLQCLHAPDRGDSYCHNHTDQIMKWKRMIWPCRSLSLEEPEVTELPFRFAYTCFRLFGHSLYGINVTLSPQMCSSFFYVTIPSERQVHPEIAELYLSDEDRQRSRGVLPWSPLVLVDTNPSDGIWIRYTEQPNFKHNKINVTIYKQISDSMLLQFAWTQVIKKPHTGFKWKDVTQGSYTVFVYVDRHDCDGTDCPHTSMNFTVYEDKFTSEKREELLLKAATRHLVFSLSGTVPYNLLATSYNFDSGVVLLVAIVLTSVLIYFRYIRPRRLARLPPQNVELQYRPSVLIIYSDDCDEHSQVVLSLAELLKEYGNATVHIDQFDLIDPKILPLSWMFETMAAVDHVIFVFSESTPRILGKEQMLSRQHYPDMFCTAVDAMFSDVHQNNNWSKYIFARMSYSPFSSIPMHLASFPARRVAVPEDFGTLVGMLHRVGANAIVDHNADLSKLKLGIHIFEEFDRSQPGWLNERFYIVENENTALLSCDNLELKPPEDLPTVEEQIALSHKYGLQVPQDEGDEADLSDSGLPVTSYRQYEVVGKPTDYDSSSTSS